MAATSRCAPLTLDCMSTRSQLFAPPQTTGSAGYEQTMSCLFEVSANRTLLLRWVRMFFSSAVLPRERLGCGILNTVHCVGSLDHAAVRISKTVKSFGADIGYHIRSSGCYRADNVPQHSVRSDSERYRHGDMARCVS